jgi:3-oxoacyl-[acyl-carrier-protein] synthase II
VLFPRPKGPAEPVRVVITGAGIITAYGAGWENNAEGFRTGRAAFKPVSIFDVSRQRVKRAGEVDLEYLTFPENRLGKRKLGRLERAEKLLFHAAHEALEQAGWTYHKRLQNNDTLDRRIPVVLGTTSGGMSKGEDFYREAIAQPMKNRWQATRVTHYLAQRQAIDLCEAYGLGGPITIIANACAAGANAVGHAWELVRSGQFKQALAGGYDGLSQMVFAGFDSLQALSTTTCRPFDATRDGLALGEGAAVLMLEDLNSAQARWATILGEIVGYGASTDSHHLTQPHPQGNAAIDSMSQACAVAGLNPGAISYINAHGTGTPLNDSAEAAAINTWAGAEVGKVRVSSTKAGIGHLLGAAGAVESVVCLLALREQWLPPMLATERPDPLAQFQLVTKPTQAKELEHPFEYALTNSFGFGGANASLIFRRTS